MHTILGIDLGGTFTKIALFSQRGKTPEIIRKRSFPTPRELPYTKLIDWLATTARECTGPQEVQRICMSLPGDIRAHSGLYLGGKLFGETASRPLAKDLQTRLGAPVEVLNDALCAALAELHEGTGKSHRDFLSLTLGTNVGCAVVANGQLLWNPKRSIGRIGHWIVSGQNSPIVCTRGHRRCLSAFFSREYFGYWAHALFRVPKEDPNATKVLFDQARKKDAERAIGAAVRCLAVSLTNLTRFFQPEVIILSGGIMQSKNFLGELKLSLREHLGTLPPPLRSSYSKEASLRGTPYIAKLIESSYI